MEVQFTAGKDPLLATEQASSRALAVAAEYVLEQANRSIPIEEGTLQRSGVASVDDNGTRAAISYDTPYAVRVHEDLVARHDAGRRAKWLEATLAEQADAVRQIIADHLRGAL